VSLVKNLMQKIVGFFVWQRTENDIKTFYNNFRTADANSDGVVTEDEIRIFFDQLRNDINTKLESGSSLSVQDVYSYVKMIFDFILKR